MIKSSASWEKTPKPFISACNQFKYLDLLYRNQQEEEKKEDLETAVTAFEDKTIETVEDTYWVKEQYQSIISKLNLMDGSDKRTELLERMTKRNEEFAPIISEMQDTITLYEAQKAKEKAEAQKKAEEDAITARKNQEIQTRKNTFLSALRDVENLEYQSSDAESLVQNAINKLSLVETYEEAASYDSRKPSTALPPCRPKVNGRPQNRQKKKPKRHPRRPTSSRLAWSSNPYEAT